MWNKFQSAKMRDHENSFGELAKCNETHPETHFCSPAFVSLYINTVTLNVKLNRPTLNTKWTSSKVAFLMLIWWFRLLTLMEKQSRKLWVKIVLKLTHWGRVTHICVNKLTTIGSDNGLSPGWRQVIIWTNAGILLIWNLGTNFSEISSETQAFSFKKMHLKMSSAKWRPFVSASMC